MDVTEDKTEATQEVSSFWGAFPTFKDADGKIHAFYYMNRPEDVLGLYTYIWTMLGVLGVDAHIANSSIHVTADQKSQWTEGADLAASSSVLVADLIAAVAGLESKMENVLDGVYSEITSNPWSCSFSDLDGISLDGGTWNTTKGRIEW